jgi:tripartite-type tricarboxylate transporter receptor subunit TctC
MMCAHLTGGVDMSRWLKLMAIVVASQCAFAGARADDFPTHPIRMIISYPAGGVADVSGRVIGQRLGEVLGQKVIVENHPGASGTLAANDVAKSTPDGYTLLLTPGDFFTMPSLAPRMAFNPNTDLRAIAMVTSTPLLVAANRDAPFNTVKELVAAAKARPDALAYGTPGTGSIDHVAGEWMANEAGIKLLQVPYRGGLETANGIAAGDVPLGVVTPSSVKALIDAGRVKVIALTGKKRSQSLPASWPTLDESGLAVDAVLWNGLFAPAGTPPAILEKLESAVGSVLTDNEVRARLNAAGIDVETLTGAAFSDRIRDETARYDRIIQLAGIKIDR